MGAVRPHLWLEVLDGLEQEGFPIEIFRGFLVTCEARPTSVRVVSVQRLFNAEPQGAVLLMQLQVDRI